MEWNKALTLDCRINWRGTVKNRLNGISAMAVLVAAHREGILSLSDATYRITGRALKCTCTNAPYRTGRHI